MPFTPFHFGPGAAFKAVLSNRFSFALFCYTQVVTDCETGYHILAGYYPIHRFFHTWLGATAVGLACAVTGRPVCQFALQLWYGRFPESLTRIFPGAATISWKAALLSSLLGTYSHVLLDSLMHRDMEPCSPWSSSNPLLRLISTPILHGICVGLGALGIACLARCDD
jgi:hypothetical protein